MDAEMDSVQLSSSCGPKRIARDMALKNLSAPQFSPKTRLARSSSGSGSRPVAFSGSMKRTSLDSRRNRSSRVVRAFAISIAFHFALFGSLEMNQRFRWLNKNPLITWLREALLKPLILYCPRRRRRVRQTPDLKFRFFSWTSTRHRPFWSRPRKRNIIHH